MSWHSAVGQAAGVVSLLGFVPYLISVVRGRTRPSMASWWIWTLVGCLIVVSYYAAGARTSIWTPVSYVIGPLLIALVSLRYGSGGWSRFDRLCVLGAGLSLLLWVLSGTPLTTLIFNILIDLLGALPTVRKTWQEPDSEDRLSWALFLIANSLNLLAVQPWTFPNASYPIYIFALALVMNALLLRRVRIK